MALALSPNHPATLMRTGLLAAQLGDRRRGVELLRKASELDPISHDVWLWLGLVYLGNGQVAVGRAALERSVQIAPQGEWPLMWLAAAELLDGRPDAALATAERLPGPKRAWLGALARHSLGDSSRSQEELDHLVAASAHDQQYQIAKAFAWRGQRDQAFEWLDRALREHDGGMTLVLIDPLVQGLHADPRWKALLRKMNLPVE